VLRNLLSNAVKFTDSGTVRLDVTVASSDGPFIVPSLRSAPTVLSFAVSDTGIGIATDKLRMIFEAFQQADGTTSRRYGGTGLGLSISKEIARLLGGSIAVSSVLGQGSTFTLYVPSVMPADHPSYGPVPGEPDDVLIIIGGEGTLAGVGTPFGSPIQALGGGSGGDPWIADPSAPAAPFAASQPAVAPPGVPELGTPWHQTGDLAGAGPTRPRLEVSIPEPIGTPFLTETTRPRLELGPDEVDPLQGATVLVVDDDVRNVFALTSALEMFGMRVQYADNGHDAIRLVQQAAVAIRLVLMDVMLPGMDGNETTSVIRAMPAFADLPILVLTAKAMPGDREKSISAGASDYITKPVDLDHLLSVMRSHMSDRP
jgi:CheY-like chemotaxis protein